jgi:hypothetical protein
MPHGLQQSCYHTFNCPAGTTQLATALLVPHLCCITFVKLLLLLLVVCHVPFLGTSHGLRHMPNPKPQTGRLQDHSGKQQAQVAALLRNMLQRSRHTCEQYPLCLHLLCCCLKLLCQTHASCCMCLHRHCITGQLIYTKPLPDSK